MYLTHMIQVVGYVIRREALTKERIITITILIERTLAPATTVGGLEPAAHPLRNQTCRPMRRERNTQLVQIFSLCRCSFIWLLRSHGLLLDLTAVSELMQSPYHMTPAVLRSMHCASSSSHIMIVRLVAFFGPILL